MFKYIKTALNHALNGLYAVVALALCLGLLGVGIWGIAELVGSRKHVVLKVILSVLIICVLVTVFYFVIPYVIDLLRYAQWLD